MDAKEFFTIPELFRPSWEPEVVSSPTKPPNMSSKFGGSSPWVSDKWPWPQCGDCNNKMRFICQLNLADLTQEMKQQTKLSGGLFQFFCCTEETCGKTQSGIVN